MQNNFSGCILKLSFGYQNPFNSTSLCHVDYLFSVRRKSLRERIFGVKIYMYSFLCLLTSGEVISPNLWKIRYRSWHMLVLPVLCTVFFLSPRWAMPSRFSCRWMLPWRVLSNGGWVGTMEPFPDRHMENLPCADLLVHDSREPRKMRPLVAKTLVPKLWAQDRVSPPSLLLLWTVMWYRVS